MQDASRIDRSAAGGIARCGDTWRLSRLAGVIAVCAWACASAPAQQAAETVVRLYPSAVVTAESVMLSDVAEVLGESAQLAARMELGAAPHIGKSGVVDLAQLQSMLARRGVNLSNWVFRGSSRCTVQRVGRIAPASATATPAALLSRSSTANAAHHSGDTPALSTLIAGGQKEPTTRPAAGTEASRAAICDPNSLEAVMREHLSRRLSDLGGTPIVRFSPGAARVLSLATPTYTFRITDRADRLLGMVPMEVTVLERGQIRQTLPVIADVSLRKTVIVASRPINRGEIIKPTHLLTEDRTFDRVDDIGVSQTAMLVGQRAKRFIDNHAVLSMRDVEQMPLVLANDLVTVFVRRGALSIRSSAKALSAAGLGDTVQLRNEMSREVFSAVVTGQKTVEVRDGMSAMKGADSETPVPVVAQNSATREEQP